jgi:hypothetical protein
MSHEQESSKPVLEVRWMWMWMWMYVLAERSGLVDGEFLFEFHIDHDDSSYMHRQLGSSLCFWVIMKTGSLK